MNRLATLSITLVGLVFVSDLATAERGGGRSGPAGPPPMSERGQQNRSSRPVREGKEPGSVHRGQQAHSKMTVGAHLEKNTHLATKLQGLLPIGTDLQLASSGFKNLGQFVAAAHVSKNLGIPFDQLKTKMTGESPISLGKAIQGLRPEADATSEVKKAERQAKEEIQQTEALRKTEVKEPEK